MATYDATQIDVYDGRRIFVSGLAENGAEMTVMSEGSAVVIQLTADDIVELVDVLNNWKAQ